MATVYWIGNSPRIAGVDQLTITAVATGGTLSVTIGAKTMTYTLLASDSTVAIAATSLLAALQAYAANVPEFAEKTWASGGSGVITATDAAPGSFVGPLSKSQGGGATMTLATTVTHSSPNDANDPLNWLRSGSNAIPVNGDDVVIWNSAVPILYNVDQLSAVQFLSYNRYQTMTGQIGLPDINVNGYFEYRAKSFKATASGTLNANIGVGPGTGPSLERYDFGTTQVNWTVNAGQTITILNVHVSSTLLMLGAQVSVAMGESETATLASATVDGAATLFLGPSVTMAGTISITNGQAFIYNVPGVIKATNGANVTVAGTGQTYASVISISSTINWNASGTITSLNISVSSTFNKSADPRALTITNATVSGDSQVLDPLSTITWSNPASVTGFVGSGPFVFNGTRTVSIV